MKITIGNLRRLIRETIDIVNSETGEILTVDSVPPKFAGRMKNGELLNVDFMALVKELTLDPDEALRDLEDRAGEIMSGQDDLGTAIDMARGLEMDMPKEWQAALESKRIAEFYSDSLRGDDENYFRNKSEALARWLAERMG